MSETRVMSDERGLYRKFEVRRTDGADAPGQRHDGCRYFVLDLDHDPHAPAALRAYADDCMSTRPRLAVDLLAIRFGDTGPLPEEE